MDGRLVAKRFCKSSREGNFLSRLERAYGIVVDLMVDDDDDRFVRYDRENSFTVGFARMVKRPAC